MKPNIIVVGKSGSGKSSSLRNLNPETTAVLNTERKQLPFKGANKFKNVPVPDLATYKAAFKKAVESDAIETIVIESFTSLIEMIYREADVRFKGFDVWSFYNKEIDSVLNMSKNTDKNIIFLAIDGAYDRFRTQSLGKDSAKSPMGMFENLHIGNDLAQVIEKCEEYYS